MQLLAYLAARPDAAVKGYIGASLIEAQIGTTPRAALLTQLESRAQRRSATWSPSMCLIAEIPLDPEALLSYVRWDQARTLRH